MTKISARLTFVKKDDRLRMIKPEVRLFDFILKPPIWAAPTSNVAWIQEKRAKSG